MARSSSGPARGSSRPFTIIARSPTVSRNELGERVFNSLRLPAVLQQQEPDRRYIPRSSLHAQHPQQFVPGRRIWGGRGVLVRERRDREPASHTVPADSLAALLWVLVRHQGFRVSGVTGLPRFRGPRGRLARWVGALVVHEAHPPAPIPGSVVFALVTLLGLDGVVL